MPERRAKRKNETRADMLKGLKAIPMYPPVNEAYPGIYKAEMFSTIWETKLDLRSSKAYTQDNWR